jgi:anti-sigma factor RsiW
VSLILDYLTGDMDPQTRRDFERHLEDCRDCVAFLKTYRKTLELVRSLRYNDIPAPARNRIREFLEAQDRGRPPVG